MRTGNETLLDLVRAHATGRGDATAVTGLGHQLSYRELWRRSGMLASYLAARGLAPGTPVAVRLASSPELVVCMLGILRAGLVYLPLDPEGPETRGRRILDDSGCRLVITGARPTGGLAAPNRPVVTFTDVMAARARPDFTDRAGEDGPAYLVYTSGSTGIPKGVLVGHRAITAYLRDIDEWYLLRATDVVLQFASPEFDISIEDIVTTFAAGARLVCRTPDLLGSVPRFVELCTTNGITVVNLPTAYWHWLTNGLAELRQGPPGALRQVMAGGEQMLADHLVTWRGLAGDRVRIVNTYGLSETTATVTAADVTSDTSEVPPMGRPLASYEAEVADGEFRISGPLLATCYWNMPALTADRFRPATSGRTPGERVFRTGDVVHRRPDGALTFGGRIDQQVKIAGHRIEPSGVESILRECPEVRDALVVPVRDEVGTVTGLAAFLVPVAGARLTHEAITELIGARLHGPSRPTVLRTVPALPFSPTGKVERTTLDPARDGERLASGTGHTGHTEPATDTERALAELWRGLLDAAQVGRDDDFLSLGGTSLHAMTAVRLVRERLGVDLPAGAMLRGTRLADLAADVERARDDEGPAAAPSPSPALASGPGRSRADEEDAGTGPLSATQQRVWFLTQVDRGNPAYQYQMYLRMTGPLDPRALWEALGEVIARHEILRTTFEESAGEPVQRVHPPFVPDLPTVDAGQLAAAGGLEEFIRRECATGFDIGRLPLARWTLLRTAPDEHVLVHVEHHLLHDGWSLGVFLDDLEFAYRATAEGEQPDWPAPAPRSRDHARAEAAWLASGAAERQRAFWRERLAGAPALTVLPTDRPRAGQQSFSGEVFACVVSTDLVNRLTEVAHRHRTTLFSVMMSAFAVLVHRHTGQQDMLLGTSTANRSRRETDGLLGMLVNNLVLRLDTTGEKTTSEMIGRVRDAMLEAFDHHELPFDQVVAAAAATSPDLSANPLFQLMFSFHDAPVRALDLAGVPTRVGYLNNSSAKFDLNVIVIPDARALDDAPADGGMRMEWEFNTGLFDRATVARYVAGYLELLAALPDADDVPVSGLPLVTAGEERELLRDGDGALAFPDQPAAQDLWDATAAQAVRNPDVVAVRWAGGQLSYRELCRGARATAGGLVRQGVEPDDVVAVVAGRCGHALTGALGAYAAGAGFLLLDADLPAERRRTLLAGSGATALLTCSHAATRDTEGLPWLDLDTVPTGPGDASPPNLPRLAQGGLAYLVHTSGSTGRPKGVLVPRSGLTRYLTWCTRYGLRPGHRVPVHTSYGVDLTVTSLLAPLTAGATVEMLPSGPDGQEALAELVTAAGADLVKLTPSHLKAFDLQLTEPLPHHPVTLVVGGEALFAPDLTAWPGTTRVINEYGPAETVVGCAVEEWQPDGAAPEAPVPIGRPVSHARLAVRAPDGRLTPYAALGELHIGGQAMARGYLNDPAATADAFRPDPDGGGARAYRTGDLVRRRTDGRLVYMGRTDRQIKVRGFRVDPGEVEAALAALPGVRAAAVALTPAVAPAAADTGQELTGYLVADDRRPDTARLRASLTGRLPSHLIPTRLRLVDRLPVTASGKTDHAALAALPAEDVTPDNGGCGALETAGQREIARVWQEVLQVERIGADSNFFDLGGHSLTALRVVARLRERRWPGLRLHDLYAGRTVAGLAAVLEGRTL
ncbi:amino acid adenylation domain-containing protein [Streptomyces tendae]|uniref:amino acid adenylation domain-containing protein n=1 Tax=Streptomyces tendae TaxID=1932 RepID=UPI003674E481